MMRMRWARVGLLVLLIGTAASMRLAGQQAALQPQEKELWTEVEKFWETIKTADLERHMALYADDITTYVSRTVRNGKEEWRAGRARQFSQSRTGYEYQLQPLSVKTYGDTGVAIYHAQSSWNDAEGKPQRYDQALLHVYRKTPDGWLLVAGTIMPPPADAQ